MEDVQATGEAFSPPKRTSSNQYKKLYFLFLGTIFALDPGADPDPVDKQH
jgi:hypothetical protein